MTILAAIDSFKGSMSSLEAGEAISNGIKKAHKEKKSIARLLMEEKEQQRRSIML